MDHFVEFFYMSIFLVVPFLQAFLTFDYIFLLSLKKRLLVLFPFLFPFIPFLDTYQFLNSTMIFSLSQDSIASSVTSMAEVSFCIQEIFCFISSAYLS